MTDSTNTHRDSTQASVPASLSPQTQPVTVISTPNASFTGTIAPKDVSPCGNLDTMLYELYLSPDPAEYATSHNLMFEDQQVGVSINLATENVDLAPYQVEIRNERANIVEAFLPVEELCNLALDPGVLKVSVLKQVQTLP